MDELADPTERAWRSTKARQLWAQPPVGERLAENCGRGVALLFEVAYQHRALFTAAEEMNPRVLARCKALVFTFERQVSGCHPPRGACGTATRRSGPVVVTLQWCVLSMPAAKPSTMYSRQPVFEPFRPASVSSFRAALVL